MLSFNPFSLWIPDKEHLISPVYSHRFCWAQPSCQDTWKVWGCPLTAFGSSTNLALISCARLGKVSLGSDHDHGSIRPCLGFLQERLQVRLFPEKWVVGVPAPVFKYKWWIREINWTKLSINLTDPSWHWLIRWLVVFGNPLCGHGMKES